MPVDTGDRKHPRSLHKPIAQRAASLSMHHNRIDMVQFRGTMSENVFPTSILNYSFNEEIFRNAKRIKLSEHAQMQILSLPSISVDVCSW